MACARVNASKAICDGELVRAAAIIDGVGHPAAAAYAHVRAARALQASGNDAEAAAHRALGEPFFRQVGAVAFLDEAGEPGLSLGGRLPSP